MSVRPFFIKCAVIYEKNGVRFNGIRHRALMYGYKFPPYARAYRIEEKLESFDVGYISHFRCTSKARAIQDIHAIRRNYVL